MFVSPGVGPTTSPAGRVSVNARPLKVVFTFALVTVKVRLVVPFNGRVDAPKAFAMDAGATTVNVAEEVDCAPVPAAVEVMVTVLL